MSGMELKGNALRNSVWDSMNVGTAQLMIIWRKDETHHYQSYTSFSWKFRQEKIAIHYSQPYKAKVTYLRFEVRQDQTPCGYDNVYTVCLPTKTLVICYLYKLILVLFMYTSCVQPRPEFLAEDVDQERKEADA